MKNKVGFNKAIKDSRNKQDLSSQIGTTLVTGGAGFLGSHIVDSLILNNNIEIKVLDNLSTGRISNLSNCLKHKRFSFINEDLRTLENSGALEDVKTVFHTAAYSNLKEGFNDSEIYYRENITNTFLLLEKIRNSKVERLLFASSAAVYGEPALISTPEEYGPLLPISPYGASKLACEALISAYSHSYGINSIILRLANIVGSRGRRGVIWDYIEKLRWNCKKLMILGDGLQSKSYMHINDCVECCLNCLSKSTRGVEIFNVGSDDKIDVISIARIVCDAMKLTGVELTTTGGVDNGRGWIGDVKQMQLNIEKLKKLSSVPKLTSRAAVALASKELFTESLKESPD